MTPETLAAIRERARWELARPAADGIYYGSHNLAVRDRELLLLEMDRLLVIVDAVRAIDLFNVALCENEGRGFSCSEIEEYADLIRTIDEELASEIIATHALEDTEEDEDMPEHLAAAKEWEKRWLD